MTRLAYLSTDPGIAYGGTKGASVHVAEITAALAAQGAEVLVVAAGIADGAQVPPGVAVEVLPGPSKGASVDDRLAAEPGRARWLADRLATFGATCLHERLSLHSAAGARAARELGIPHVVELNAPLLEEAARYRALERAGDAERLEVLVLGAADVVVAVSRPLAEYGRRRGARRVEVLPNAVDVGRFLDPRSRSATPKATAVLAGSLRPWHGVEVVAEAWRLMGNGAPALLVIGDGPGRELLEGAGGRVTGAVRHSEVASWLHHGDIGLVPYAADAPRYFSPLKLFEYLAAGLAVVAADVPGVVDVVGPEAAVLVPPGSPEALAEAVTSLVPDVEHRRCLGLHGREVVERGHTWSDRARRLLELGSTSALEGARS